MFAVGISEFFHKLTLRNTITKTTLQDGSMHYLCGILSINHSFLWFIYCTVYKTLKKDFSLLFIQTILLSLSLFLKQNKCLNILILLILFFEVEGRYTYVFCFCLLCNKLSFCSFSWLLSFTIDIWLLFRFRALSPDME